MEPFPADTMTWEKGAVLWSVTRFDPPLTALLIVVTDVDGPPPPAGGDPACWDADWAPETDWTPARKLLTTRPEGPVDDFTQLAPDRSKTAQIFTIVRERANRNLDPSIGFRRPAQEG